MSSTADMLRRYRSNPMEFFGDLRVPIRGGVPFRSVWYPFQEDFLRQISPCLLASVAGEPPPYRAAWCEMSKGCGKGSLTMMAALWVILFSARTILAEIGAGDLGQSSEGLKILRQLLSLNRWIGERVEPQASRVVCRSTDSVVEFLCSNELGSHGSRPRLSIISELTHVSHSGFPATMMDNASKDPANFLIIECNAGFADSWQWAWREISLTSPRWIFFQHAAPAPWISAAELAESRQRNSLGRYRRLFEGVWQSGSDGDSIPAEHIDRSIVHPGPLVYRENGMGIIGGLDLGLRHDHSSVVTLAVDYRRCRIRVADVQNFAPPQGGEVDLRTVRDSVLRLRDRLGLRAIVYDEWQGAQLATELREARIFCEPIYPSAKNQTAMAVSLMTVFRNGLIELFPEPLLLHDLRYCTIVDKGTGYAIASPRDLHGHGDRLTALCLCLPTALDCLNNPQPSFGGDGMGGNLLQAKERLDAWQDGYEERLRAIRSW